MYDSKIKDGFTMKEAIEEAKRCLDCKKATCIPACPIENRIPEFIRELSKGNLGEAREILADKTNLPAVCGRVCPHELQCEGHCVLNKKNIPIKIGKLEQFIADFDSDMNLTRERLLPKDRGRVAVIGSGPAGLTVAGDLARKGFNVVVYEGQREPGGILLYGIPEFRLPAKIVQKEIEKIESLGVSFITNTKVGEKLTVDDMFENQFDAVFIGTGTALSKDVTLLGREKTNIFQSTYFLRMVALYNKNQVDKNEVPVASGDDVLVIGGGNVAMDASRTAILMGAKSVTIVYYKEKEDMTALRVESDAAEEEGVDFSFNTNSLEFLGDEFITGLRATKEGEEIILKANKILLAVGSRPADRIVSTTEGIEINEQGYVITRDKPYGMTTRKGVFAGGDVVHMPATVVLAMKEAQKVAYGIEKYIDAIKLLGLDK